MRVSGIALIALATLTALLLPGVSGDAQTAAPATLLACTRACGEVERQCCAPSVAAGQGCSLSCADGLRYCDLDCERRFPASRP